MSKKSAVIDLIPLLDVMLILIFLVMMQNADILAHQENEFITRRAYIEETLDERVRVLDAKETAINVWRAIVEEEVYIIQINMQPGQENDDRVIILEAPEQETSTIQVSWRGNVIDRDDEIVGEVLSLLDRFVPTTRFQIALIIFNMGVYRQDRLLFERVMAEIKEQDEGPRIFISIR